MNYKISIFVIFLVLAGMGIFQVQAGEEKEISGNGGKLQGTIARIRLKKQVIKTKAEGEIIHYFQESFYSEDDFSAIAENKEKFKSDQIKILKKELIGVSAENIEFNLDQAKNSVILKCDIKGAMYNTNSYSMHFLLGNWPFDLYQFKEYERKLVYEGKIAGVPTKIVFEFPYPLSHCHEHVWPKQ